MKTKLADINKTPLLLYVCRRIILKQALYFPHADILSIHLSLLYLKLFHLCELQRMCCEKKNTIKISVP